MGESLSRIPRSHLCFSEISLTGLARFFIERETDIPIDFLMWRDLAKRAVPLTRSFKTGPEQSLFGKN